MKLYKYISGHDEKFAAAENEQDAFERRAEIDPTFHFMDVRIEEVVVPGYEITVTETNPSKTKRK